MIVSLIQLYYFVRIKLFSKQSLRQVKIRNSDLKVVCLKKDQSNIIETKKNQNILVVSAHSVEKWPKVKTIL
jgi:hypothetical protein